MRSTPLTALAAATLTSLALVAGSTVTAQAVPAVAHAETASAIQAKRSGTEVRFATFNVRTSRADRGTSRHWLRRASSVAREIKSRNPDIVALQELGPGRADGKKAKIGNSKRQTESLLSSLRKVGANQYKLTRTTSYVKPGTTHGTQGARILYNAQKFRLVSKCHETTGKKNYNYSCSIDLPVLKGESRSNTRSAAYAEFENRRTGKNFFVISAHLDTRHSGNRAKEERYDALREAQVRRVYSKVKSLNKHGYPVLFGGDINSWRTKSGRHAPYNYLTKASFSDLTKSATQIDAKYPTVNHWKRVLKANAKGRQVALDIVMGRGVKMSMKYENVMKVRDSSRPSDHNMVLADTLI